MAMAPASIISGVMLMRLDFPSPTGHLAAREQIG